MGDTVLDRESFAVSTYAADKERNIRLIRWLLKSVCLWPYSNKASIVDRVLSKFSRLTCLSLLLITWVGIGLVVFVEARGNVDLMMMHIGPFVCYLMAVLKYICLVLHVDDIRSCVNCIELDWNIMRSNEDHEVMLQNAKTGRFMAIFIAAFMHSGVQSYNITRVFTKNVVDVDNVSITIHELPYPFYNEILDARFSPTFEMMLILQIVSSFLVSGVTSVNCGLMATFVMHACGQLQILKQWLGDFVHDNGVVNINTAQQKLGFIVEHHLRVINNNTTDAISINNFLYFFFLTITTYCTYICSFVSYIEEVIYLTCLVELVGGSLTLCILGYSSITAWNQDKKENVPTYCIIALSFTLNIFIICYIAEVLSEQYKQVGMETYMTKWYRLPPKTALGLLLINLRCNFNINLSAGKMVDLSLYTFGNVLKAAMTYLNMLRQMTA